MNTGQMLLTTGAVLLFGLTVTAVNRMHSHHGSILRQSEIGVYAVSIATSIIEEASGKAFDEATVDDAITSTSSLSNTLGKETGETTTPLSTARFDDFDDYNNGTFVFSIAGVDSFIVQTTVVYVSPSNPSGISSTRTFHKRLDVSVVGVSSPDTIRMSYVFSYFNFR